MRRRPVFLIFTIILICIFACTKKNKISSVESLFSWEHMQTNEVSEILYKDLFSVYAYIDTTRLIRISTDRKTYSLVSLDVSHGDAAAGNAMLKLYDLNFNKIKSVEIRAGQGPGEFAIPANTGLMAGRHYISIYDFFLNRISWFDQELELIDTKNVDNIAGVTALYSWGNDITGFIVSINEEVFRFIECDKELEIKNEYTTPEIFSKRDFTTKCFEDNDYVLMRSDKHFLTFNKGEKLFKDFTINDHSDLYAFFNYFDGRYMYMTPWDEDKMSYVYDIKTKKIHTFKSRRMIIYVDETHILELVNDGDEYFIKTYQIRR